MILLKFDIAILVGRLLIKLYTKLDILFILNISMYKLPHYA